MAGDQGEVGAVDAGGAQMSIRVGVASTSAARLGGTGIVRSWFFC
jgi:hypothetical protein